MANLFCVLFNLLIIYASLLFTKKWNLYEPSLLSRPRTALCYIMKELKKAPSWKRVYKEFRKLNSIEKSILTKSMHKITLLVCFFWKFWYPTLWSILPASRFESCTWKHYKATIKQSCTRGKDALFHVSCFNNSSMFYSWLIFLSISVF